MGGFSHKSVRIRQPAAGKSAEVAAQLRKTPGVKSAAVCWGLPDIVALVDAADSAALRELVLNRIQKPPA